MIDQSLTLPCGAVLENRLSKAALTERLASDRNRANERHQRLYRRWSHSGAGLIITGNVVIDRQHLEAAGNVVLDANADLDGLRAYAAAGREAGNHLWMQLSHAGRQTPGKINPAPKAPSAVALDMKGDQVTPVAMTQGDLDGVVAGFGFATAKARETGFTGIQIHAAHGYLLSSFLNPRANRRDDDYGGSLENRARLLLAVVQAARAAGGDDFPVSVKLNSTDFQSDGFTLEECARVAKWLEDAGVDLLEVSGGNYELPAMIVGQRGDLPVVKESTRAREAFFIDYAAYLRQHTQIPMMVTGGFRTRDAMIEALESGAADVIGLGRPLCNQPEVPRALLQGAGAADPAEFDPPYAQMPWYYSQIFRMGEGRDPDPALPGADAMAEFADREAKTLADLMSSAGQSPE